MTTGISRAVRLTAVETEGVWTEIRPISLARSSGAGTRAWLSEQRRGPLTESGTPR
jgi:hypothetical protein